jgi:hypothetical protein
MPKHRIRRPSRLVPAPGSTWSRRGAGGSQVDPAHSRSPAAQGRRGAAWRPPTDAAWRSTGSRRTHPYAHRAGTAGVRPSAADGLGRRAVDGLRDLGGLLLDLAEGTGGQQPSSDGVADCVGEHGTLAAAVAAAAGVPCSRPAQALRTARTVSGLPVPSPAGMPSRSSPAWVICGGDGPTGTGGVETPYRTGPGAGHRMPVCAMWLGCGDRGERLGGGRRDFAARPGHFICAQAQTCSYQVTLARTALSGRAARSPGQRACHRAPRHEGAHERVRQAPGGEWLAASATAGTDRRRDPEHIRHHHEPGFLNCSTSSYTSSASFSNPSSESGR